jgi:hypothetical protein
MAQQSQREVSERIITDFSRCKDDPKFVTQELRITDLRERVLLNCLPIRVQQIVALSKERRIIVKVLREATNVNCQELGCGFCQRRRSRPINSLGECGQCT